MNSIDTIDTEYINRACRTLETVQVRNGGFKTKLFWIYNFEGVHFRVFDCMMDVINFFTESIEAKYSFDNENDLDNFLLNVRI